MATNLIDEDRIFLEDRISGGNILTLPAAANTAYINIIEGKVRFTLDGTDPLSCDGTLAYKGQTIDLREFSNQRSILEKFRMIPIVTKKRSTARIVVWYFD